MFYSILLAPNIVSFLYHSVDSETWQKGKKEGKKKQGE